MLKGLDKVSNLINSSDPNKTQTYDHQAVPTDSCKTSCNYQQPSDTSPIFQPPESFPVLTPACPRVGDSPRTCPQVENYTRTYPQLTDNAYKSTSSWILPAKWSISYWGFPRLVATSRKWNFEHFVKRKRKKALVVCFAFDFNCS